MSLMLRFFLLSAVVPIFATSIFVATVQANGRVGRFDRQLAGPYEIGLGTIPATPGVGNLHLTVSVADAVSKVYITGADVVVTASEPGAGEIGPLNAYDSLQGVGFYDVNTSVDMEGMWTFTVAVSSEIGDASVPFEIEVKNANPVAGVVTLVVLVALLTVIGLSVRTLISDRGRPRPKRRSRT